MSDLTASRRMRLLDTIRSENQGIDLADCAMRLGVDERTIRRDVEYLQEMLEDVQQVEIRRGYIYAKSATHETGYFEVQSAQRTQEKEAIAREIAASLPDHAAIALTAGSTNFRIAREICRKEIDPDTRLNLIVFTNSLPALQELTHAGVDTGVLGEIYNAEDQAFHSADFHSAFQPGLLIVGASGAVVETDGSLQLYSHRSEEAVFLRQLIQRAPQVIVALDSSKIGKIHPWPFAGNSSFAGKKVVLYTTSMDQPRLHSLENLKNSNTFDFDYHIVIG